MSKYILSDYVLVGIESREEKTVKKQHEHRFGRALRARRRAGKKPSFGAQMRRLIRKAWLEIMLAKVHIDCIVNKQACIKETYVINQNFFLVADNSEMP